MYSFSNSDILEWLKCQRSYYYSRDLGLTPKVNSSALNKGTVGHSLLEAWYSTLKFKAVEEKYIELCKENTDNFKENSDILRLVLEYIRYYYPDERYYPKVLHVEEAFEVDIMKGMKFKFKPDVILNLFEDKRVLMDHKFVWNFYDEDKLALMPQMLKYVTALNSIGIHIDYIIINQLRTRNVSTTRYERTYLSFSNEEIARTWNEHTSTVVKLQEWTNKSMGARNNDSVRCFNPPVCGTCAFKQLCIGDLKNQDTSILMQDFKENDYVGTDYPRKH